MEVFLGDIAGSWVNDFGYGIYVVIQSQIQLGFMQWHLLEERQ
jgi:hypothetical protein